MTIPDSIDTLNAALATHQGTARERRVRLLIALKEDPDRAVTDVARELGIPQRTAKWWIKLYREGGLLGLLRIQARGEGEPSPLPSAPLLQVNENAVPFSILNRLPMSIDTREWGAALGRLLAEFLEDVDHVAVNVRYTVDLLHPESDRGGIVYHQDHDRVTARTRARIAGTRDRSGWESLYAQAEKAGFPVAAFQKPIGFDYWYQVPQARIGSLLFFRRVGASPISLATQRKIDQLRPFIVYVLSDHVARRRLTQPADMLWRDMLDRVDSDAKLTERQKQVIALLLAGYTHVEIADSLHLALKTIHRHVQNIFSKLHVSRLSELIALYTTPRLPEGQ